MRYLTYGKPLFDRATAVLVLVLLWPVLAATALTVRIGLGRPILFRQERPGHLGKPFTLYKFRTMTESRDAEGRLLPDGERLSKLGRFLRSISLDELPELFNVLKGDMSVVGPRPLLMKYLERYTPQQMRRHDVRPGITGWAQVNGRNDLTWEDKFALDLWYVDNASFLLDLRIIVLTIRAILRREGISEAGHPTAREFMGGQS